MPTQAALPLFYDSIVPLSDPAHAGWKCPAIERLPWLAGQNVVPLTIDEFSLAQCHYPIVFSTDEAPVPLALMGLEPGTNRFVDAAGAPVGQTYIPAYARRYPFVLARATPDAAHLSLCFDAASGLVGPEAEGQPLFVEGAPSEACLAILRFCESFDAAGERTRAFIAEMQRHDLLVEGEARVTGGDAGEGHRFNGFRVIDAERLKGLRGYVFRQWADRGYLPLVFAHLFSLERIGLLAVSVAPPAEAPTELLLEEPVAG